VDKVSTEEGIFMKVPDNVHWLHEGFPADLNLKVVDPGNMNCLAASPMAGASGPNFLRG
jgi:hypothetical protein